MAAASPVVACADPTTLEVMTPGVGDDAPPTVRAFRFDLCCHDGFSQADFFDHSGVQPLVDAALAGLQATVLAYGPTGSGKTYTIAGKPDSIIKHGTGDASDGVVIRSVEALFEKIRALQRDGLQFKVSGPSLAMR